MVVFFEVFCFWFILKDLYSWNAHNSMLQIIAPVIIEN